MSRKSSGWSDNSGLSLWPLVPGIPSQQDLIIDADRLADLSNHTLANQTTILLSKDEIPQPQLGNIKLVTPKATK